MLSRKVWRSREKTWSGGGAVLEIPHSVTVKGVF